VEEIGYPMLEDMLKPNFYIIGAAKAGTTTLYQLLAQHPEVYMPYDKEPSFFCDDEYYQRGEEWYVSTFFNKESNKLVRGEASSRYLYFGEKVAPRIKQFNNPRAPKIIAIFRDPVKLVPSFYWNSVREGKEVLPFEQALNDELERLQNTEFEFARRGHFLYAYSKIGNYASQIKHYLKLFPRENCLFLLTEDLYDFDKLKISLSNFLGVTPFPESTQPSISNAAALPKFRTIHNFLRERSVIKDLVKPFIPASLRFLMKDKAISHNLLPFKQPPLDPAIETRIRAHFREEVLQLQDLIGRDLGAWA
jgi:hypothetical protein